MRGTGTFGGGKLLALSAAKCKPTSSPRLLIASPSGSGADRSTSAREAGLGANPRALCCTKATLVAVKLQRCFSSHIPVLFFLPVLCLF